MFEFLYQRIRNNIWLYLFLLLGAVLAVAIFSSIPMYSNGVLQRMLIKDLEIQQQELDIHSGQFKVTRNYLRRSHQDMIPEIELEVQALFDLNTIPSLLETKNRMSNYYQLRTQKGALIHQNANFSAINDLEEHISLISGRYPVSNSDYLEVMLTEGALEHYGLAFEGVYDMSFSGEVVKTMKVVGIYTVSDVYDFYWGDGLIEAMDDYITISNELYDDMTAEIDTFHTSTIIWKAFYDYHKIEISDVPQILENDIIQTKKIANLGDGFELKFDLAKTLDGYAVREEVLRLTLWILTVPVLIITCFYTYMISMLIVRNDENEIAMLKSRGAGTYQIYTLYVVQSAVMSIVSLIVGPWLGYLICKIIGASNGFLQFVNRSGLPIEMSIEVMAYGLVAALVFMIFMLIPAHRACRMSIVQYKRKKNLDISKTLWERAFLDVIIIAISGYGYYAFVNTGSLVATSGDSSGIDPFLFLVPTLFVLGFGLLFVRLYPYLIRFVYFVGKNRWRPVMYYSLLNASRAERTSKFISLFIVLFLAFGLLNASQARTLNQNAMDQVNYEYVTDLRVQPYIPEREINDYWSNFIDQFDIADGNIVVEDKVPYREYENLEGIHSATKVLVKDDVFMQTSIVKQRKMNMLAVVPHEFAKMAWSRDGLLDHHLVDYMNIMTKYPTAVFISSEFAEDDKIRVGDSVELIWDKYSVIGVVYGFIDYFPSFNPYISDEPDEAVEKFVLANFDYLEDKLPVQKYEIWMNKEEGVRDQQILDNLSVQKLETERAKYRDQALMKKSNDPMLQGTNGVLTMSYVIILLITMVGYLIFWVLNIRSRALKFGIFRAMGMGMRQVTSIIITEQLIMIFGALIAGLTIGTVASRVFVPMLQKFDVASSQIPPFRVVNLQSDYINIAFITMVMLTIVLLILNGMVKRFKVNQVIKLGED